MAVLAVQLFHVSLVPVPLLNGAGLLRKSRLQYRAPRQEESGNSSKSGASPDEASANEIIPRRGIAPCQGQTTPAGPSPAKPSSICLRRLRGHDKCPRRNMNRHMESQRPASLGDAGLKTDKFRKTVRLSDAAAKEYRQCDPGPGHPR